MMVIAIAAVAQPTVTLLTFESYTFDESFNTDYGKAKVKGAFQWGGGFEFGVDDYMAIELIYQRQDADIIYNELGSQYTGTAGINYIMLGGTRYQPLNDMISGFGTLDVGAMWTEPDASLQSESVTKFSVGGRLGLRITASEKVSLRLHAQLFSPVQWGGLYFGTGGAGVSTGSSIFQFNLGGSVNFRLK
ncbi:MAG: hypothetical protein HC811_12335 [Flammeovirgaceae bacterium]|nr:hypothetical protein [Flammeovirgaceae bacterium]